MRFKPSLPLSLAASLLFSAAWADGGWQVIDDGIQHRAATYRKGDRERRDHFFRIDPSRRRPDLLIAGDDQVPHLSAKAFREKSGALLVINGGFFDEKFRSLGLLVRRGVVINPLRPADWGIFQWGPQTLAVIHRRDWTGEGVEFAIQVGPRLVVDGRIPSFKAEKEPHRRSALGVTADSQILVAISESPLPIREWAEELQREAVSALNLDGGGSSQISVKLGGFSLELPGTTGVPNAIGIFARVAN